MGTPTSALIERAQHAPGTHMLDSIRQGNLPGVGMTVIDGVVRSQRSRNTPPANTAGAGFGLRARPTNSYP